MKRLLFLLLTVILAGLTACGQQPSASVSENPSAEQEAQIAHDSSAPEDTQDSDERPEAGTDSESNNSQDAEETDSVTAQWKETLDSYEAFVDEYVAFMESYTAAEDPSSMLAEYTDYLARCAEWAEKCGNIDEETLSEADMQYYSEVSARIAQKLSAVATA